MSKKRKPEPAEAPERPWQNAAIICFLVIVTMTIYWQTTGFDFVNLDDPGYVYENQRVLDGLTLDGIRWAFTSFHQLNWHPMTWLSLMADGQIVKWMAAADYELGIQGSGVYHLTNALMHAANAVLLFLALNAMTGCKWRSGIAAALFAVHPTHVESVAWVTERKDALSGFFWMLTLCAYVWYVRAPSVRRYLAVLAAYALGLMSKPMLVSLPFVLLVLDFWPLERLRSDRGLTWPRLLIEKTPFLAMAAGSSVITLIAQTTQKGVVPFDVLPIGIRAANAVVAYVNYILMMFWPARLACMYPHPDATIPTWQVPISALVLTAITALALWSARRRPYLTSGWLWYAITLVPVCGLVQVGRQSMADRYTYIPYTGLFVMVIWGLGEVFERSRKLIRTGAALAAAAIIALGVRAYIQTSYWKDSETVMRHAISVTKENYVAENNLAFALHGKGEVEESIYHFRKAIEYHPDYVDALYNLGSVYGMKGDLYKAEALLIRAIQLAPNHAAAHNNLGLTYIRQRRLDEAIEAFRRALEIDPGYEKARENYERGLAVKRARILEQPP